MTPAEAYEHVRLRRPRVLLASAQWQVSHHQNYICFCMPCTSYAHF
jgi:transcriptional regulator GlxA family with amidase domain